MGVFRVKIVNPEKEPIEGVLVCSNHMSLLDPVIICASMKNQICFMAKKELFKIPLLNFLIKAFGAFPVNRGSVDLTAMKTAIKLLSEKKFVGIFPQGTRLRGKSLRDTEVKSGAGMILSRAESDVLPVAIITKNNKFSFGKRIYVVLGDVIKFDELGFKERNRDEFESVSRIIFEKICDLYDEYSYLVGENKDGNQ